MKSICIKSVSLAALAALPLIASAQFSANVALTTNYKFRGQDQVWTKTGALKPALQGGFDYAFSNGVYLGNWNSSINFGDGASLETDFYGGYKGELGSGIGYDVGLLKYAYSGAPINNTTEAYLGLSYGPLTAKYSTTVSNQYFATGTKATYLNVAYAQEIAKGLSLKAAVGYTNYKDNTATLPDYTDYSLGAAYDLGGGVSLSGALVGATKSSVFVFGDGVAVNKNRFILTLSKAM